MMVRSRSWWVFLPEMVVYGEGLAEDPDPDAEEEEDEEEDEEEEEREDEEPLVLWRLDVGAGRSMLRTFPALLAWFSLS